MDAGLTIRPTDGAAQAAFARPSPAPVPQAVATDLAPSQAVTAAANVAAARNDAQPAVPAELEPATKVDIGFDKHTHQAVLRIVDARTGKLIVQVPQQASTDLTV